MPLEEPAWWYAPGAHPMARLLGPLATLYGKVAVQRLSRARPYRSRLPVICIGNFTAGGTGKTPLTLHLCALLAGRGEHPVALTRGYGGTLAGPYWVDAAQDGGAQVGDEALLLAAATRTLLARDRGAGARAIENGPHAVTVIVMDDGLQNPGLEKDLSIAVVDGARGFGNGQVIPAGPLRAPLAFQLELADAILVNEPSGAPSALAESLRASFTGPVLRAHVVPREDPAWLREKPVVAWAGIGSPNRFFSLLETLGADLRARRAFKDHHAVTAQEAAGLLALAEQQGAQIVTTEKDHVRLKGSAGPVAELAARSRPLGVKLAFAPGDEERLAELVASALHGRRAAA